MKKEIEQKLARALGAEDTELLPFLPYLLQDLQNLGTPEKPVIDMLKSHIPDIANGKVLDLGAGKGCVGIPVAKETGASVHLVDAFSEFIECAVTKAMEEGIANCTFTAEDITQTVKSARGYDLVMLLSVGNIFGDFTSLSTLNALKQTVKKGGYILIEESYFEDAPFEVKCQAKYETLADWRRSFELAGVTLVAQYNEWGTEDGIDFDSDNAYIAARAAELSEKYPDKKALFEGYVQSQLNECDDLGRLQTAIWLLKSA
ncbi:MAG: class I SAM-dependent methyltransferase [Firmicutes bacterium]|nr:class I SAM-dependent methyltransferase [Bacillota bacterium]